MKESNKYKNENIIVILLSFFVIIICFYHSLAFEHLSKFFCNLPNLFSSLVSAGDPVINTYIILTLLFIVISVTIIRVLIDALVYIYNHPCSYIDYD